MAILPRHVIDHHQISINAISAKTLLHPKFQVSKFNGFGVIAHTKNLAKEKIKEKKQYKSQNFDILKLHLQAV